jgi:hypothetical protein
MLARWCTGSGVGDREGLTSLDVGNAGELPAAYELVDQVAGGAEEHLSMTEREKIGVVEGEDLRRDTGDRTVGVLRRCAGGVLEVLCSDDAGPLILRTEGEAMAILLMDTDLEGVLAAMEEGIEQVVDGREGLHEVRALSRNTDDGRVREIDVRSVVARTAVVVLLEIVLADIPDADVQTLLELVLDRKVVLLGVGRGELG